GAQVRTAEELAIAQGVFSPTDLEHDPLTPHVRTHLQIEVQRAHLAVGLPLQELPPTSSGQRSLQGHPGLARLRSASDHYLVAVHDEIIKSPRRRGVRFSYQCHNRIPRVSVAFLAVCDQSRFLYSRPIA